jgi:hypothetical protein
MSNPITDRNKLREWVIDQTLSAIMHNTSGESDYINKSSIRPKVIRDGKVVDSGETYYNYERRVLYSQDFKSIFGFEGGEFIDSVIDNCYTYTDLFFEDVTISDYTAVYDDGEGMITFDNCVAGASGDDPTAGSPYELIITEEQINGFLSQFVTFNTGSTDIDSIRAEQILNTRISELLPTELTRQQRINKFFAEFLQLIGDVPNFDLDVDFDNIMDTWDDSEIQPQQDLYHSGSSVTQNPTTGNIVRLDRHAKDTINQNKTLETLRNTLNKHLTDIDKKIEPDIVDGRPEYQNRGDGYLKIRSLNQSILIRNEQGNDVGIVGSDVNNPTFLDTGFTIGMWVRFLDRTGGGTLFNFGNPVRTTEPKGFRLETYTLYKNDKLRPDFDYTWMEYIMSHTIGSTYSHPQIPENMEYFAADNTFFQDNDYERFVRLIVRESNGQPRESNTGARWAKEGAIFSRQNHSGMNRIPSNGLYPIIWPETIEEADTHYPNRLLSYTRIPVDFNEWYYVVASYDPDIDEDGSFGYIDTYAPDGVHSLSFFSEFWNGNVMPESQVASAEQIAANPDNLTDETMIGKYVTKSGYGNRCKVEFISKNDLLRARGFKPENNNQGAATGGNQVVGG